MTARPSTTSRSCRAGLFLAEALAECETLTQTMELRTALLSSLFYYTSFLPAYGMEYD